ncbi:coiled-coil domain-containing protein 30 isoform X2 [Hemicordylus capensis]|uniref:coiled-coil domain-containing protein 30 isoform X2 n=2 Tax=Hemicordylus capensis TaxID=884348 RepID=UPI0023042A46|nr:coiled-coil domain-containing protein 30 isoform X2 [Hemicordylus capensis]
MEGARPVELRVADMVSHILVSNLKGGRSETFKNLIPTCTLKEQAHAGDIRRRLQEEGGDPAASADEQLCYVWGLLLSGREKLGSVTSELEQLRQRQAEEMREVESYVRHVRTLTEVRDALATAFEKENKQLRMELVQLQSKHESQQKEVEEMLEQEGLVEITRSSPSEQVAYLLVERSTLLEKLEALEQKLDSPSCLESLYTAQLQNELDHIRQMLEDELQEQRESMQRTKEMMNKSHAEELAREIALRQCAEQDLDEAARRLQMAHGEIWRRVEEVDVQEKEQSKLEMSELQKAREQNVQLNKEILALRNRVRFLDYERSLFLDQVATLKDKIPEHQKPEEEPQLLLAEMEDAEKPEDCRMQVKNETVKTQEASVSDEATPDREDDEIVHKRCRQVIEGLRCRNSQLVYRLDKLAKEHEELVERNEELESLLGETQNRTKEEREQLEAELDGLQRKISFLEAELRQAQKLKMDAADEEPRKEGQDCQEILKTHQEVVEVLESKLSGETEWRKQLGRELEGTQKALKEEKKELQNSKSELLRLYSELQRLRGAAEERDFLNVTHEKLQQENARLETKVSELSQECEELNRFVTAQKVSGKRSSASGRTCLPPEDKEKLLEDKIHSLGEEKEQLCAKFLEGTKKTEELEKLLKGSHEEKQVLWEENAHLRKDVLALRQQLSSAASVRAKTETGFVENRPLKPQITAGSAEGDLNQRLPGERLLQQQRQEDLQQLRQDLQRVQNVCSSAEKELRYEREKNLELKKQSILFQQENVKTKAELRQVQLKLSDSSKACSSLTSQWELSHQKVKELELELLRQAQAAKQQSGLQEKLAQEKARAAEAEKRVLELQRLLKECHHQVRLSETHISGKKQLEEDVKEAREIKVETQRQLEEEQRKRKLLEQRTEELQLQLRQARQKETELAAMQVQYQNQEAQRRVLEEEKKALSDEHLHCQKYSRKLSEQLMALQQEKESLHEEYGYLLKQVEISVRKHSERHLRHKAKLRRAKETFIHEVKQRDVRIKQLEGELLLSKSQTEKNQVLMRQMTAENESLLQERRKLLLQHLDLEEAEWSSKQVVSTIQNRARLLDEENKQLQERVLQLTSQVCALKSALRRTHCHSSEDRSSPGVSECQLQSKMLPISSVSLSVTELSDSLSLLKAVVSRLRHPPFRRETETQPLPTWGSNRGSSCLSVTELSDSLSLLKAIQDGKPEGATERPLLSPSPRQPSELSYLNVASPGDATDVQKEEEEEEEDQPFGGEPV